MRFNRKNFPRPKNTGFELGLNILINLAITKLLCKHCFYPTEILPEKHNRH